MYKDILSPDQQQLLPFIKSFSHDFYFVGGTALALQIGHRRSIDFDLFSDNDFDPLKIRKRILQNKTISHTFTQGSGELTILVDKVKITFFHYPFPIVRNLIYAETINIPDTLTIGAMKSFALGRRAKWKDYVDLYFILQKFSFVQLIDKTNNIFGPEFNEKLFRTQLCYFSDIDYSEEIKYMPGFEKKDEEIKKFLEKISLS